MVAEQMADKMDGVDEVSESGTKKGKRSKDELQDLRYTLQTDRLIKIYVAENATPYLVPTAILTSLSEYFVKALALSGKLGGEDGTLRFPEDDQTAWEMLLCWKIRGKFPGGSDNNVDSNEELRRYVSCWILGDKYDIKTFQDLAMVEVLQTLQGAYVSFDLVKLVFERTPEDSPLRAVMARETLSNLCVSGVWKTPDLTFFDGLTGFTAELMKANTILRDSGNVDSSLSVDLAVRAQWQQFMVGGGPVEHWLNKYMRVVEADRRRGVDTLS